MSDEKEQILEATDRLKRELMPETDRHALAAAILEFVQQLPARRSSPEQFAIKLAAHLSTHGVFAHQRRAVERLIQNQPLELDAVLSQSWLKELRDLTKWLHSSGWKRPRSTPAKSEEERLARLRKAKGRYERRRSGASRVKHGSIEADFSSGPLSTRLFDPLSTLLGQAPVRRTSSLDEVLRGGSVPMVAPPASTSLESLLGVSRKFLPRNLPCRRAGRKTLYGYDALLCCMAALLSANRWLVDAERRTAVLSGVIQRARDVATPEVATVVVNALTPHLR